MTLDPDLLQQARSSHQQLEEAERQSALARAEYHTAVRRLHMGGGSLREIGRALGLSHQRVQQIVDASGGSWWSRMWRTRGTPRDATCTFCGRSPSEVAKLIAGPDVYICDGCVSMGEHTVAGGTKNSVMSLAAQRRRCSFCGEPRTPERAIAERAGARVCRACLELCRGILDNPAFGQAPAARAH